MVNLAIAVAVFAELHGHFPSDALAASGRDVVAVVFLFGVLGEIFVGLKKSVLQVLQVGVEREGLDDFAFLTVGVGVHDHDLGSAFAFGDGP